MLRTNVEGSEVVVRAAAAVGCAEGRADLVGRHDRRTRGGRRSRGHPAPRIVPLRRTNARSSSPSSGCSPSAEELGIEVVSREPVVRPGTGTHGRFGAAALPPGRRATPVHRGHATCRSSMSTTARRRTSSPESRGDAGPAVRGERREPHDAAGDGAGAVGRRSAPARDPAAAERGDRRRVPWRRGSRP